MCLRLGFFLYDCHFVDFGHFQKAFPADESTIVYYGGLWAFHPIFRFSLVFGRRSYENMKILRNMFVYIFKSLACLALQMETIVKKITQPKLPKTKNEVTKICNEPGISFEIWIDFYLLTWKEKDNFKYSSSLRIICFDFCPAHYIFW